MKLRDAVWIAGLTGAGMLLYGALVESERLVLERRTLRLRRWPQSMSGFRIGLLADFHLRDQWSLRLARRAVGIAVRESPDVLAFTGDFLDFWRPNSLSLLRDALEPMRGYEGPSVAVPGNHDYWGADAGQFEPVLEEFGIRLLRNEACRTGEVVWVGVDSFTMKQAEPHEAVADGLALARSRALVRAGAEEVLAKGRTPVVTAEEEPPLICLWHEPDVVKNLPPGCSLMLSGHSHGGQFRLPPGWAPMTVKNGREYLAGFFPEAPTPLYVSRGVGTTGPPSRFLCPPEVSVLTLEPA